MSGAARNSPSELETNLGRERRMEGIARAKAGGIFAGKMGEPRHAGVVEY